MSINQYSLYELKSNIEQYFTKKQNTSMFIPLNEMTDSSPFFLGGLWVVVVVLVMVVQVVGGGGLRGSMLPSVLFFIPPFSPQEKL